MCARFTVLNETPIASAIAGCVIPLSRSSTIWMRSRCAAGIFHRSAVFNCRICFLVHLTIRPPESDSQSESYRVPSCETEKRQKSPDSNSYGSGITAIEVNETCPQVIDDFSHPIPVLERELDAIEMYIGPLIDMMLEDKE